MSERGWIPESGKIVIASADIAARMAEVAPEPERVYTMLGYPEGKVYVLDLDAVRESMPFTMNKDR